MKHLTPLILLRRLLTAALLAGGLAGAATAGAQTSAPPDQSSDDVVVLSPFVVQGNEDASYQARDTLAGTRIRTDLKDVGAAVSVFTTKFLEDTNSTDIEDLFVYGTALEVNGQGGNYLGQGDGVYLTSTDINQPSNSTRIRGLDNADNTRNFFLSSIPLDAYNVSRIDVQRGPNSILFGIGSPAGIYNSSMNTATFRNQVEVRNTVGSFGSVRTSLDLNHVLIPKQLAIRVDAVDDNTKYREDPAYKHSKRLYGTVKWDPAFLNHGSAHTSLTANFETGRIDGNSPRTSPPGDAITAWFTDPAFDDPNNPNQRLTYDIYPAVTTGTAGPNPWLGIPGNRVFGGIVTEYVDGQPQLSFTGSVKSWPKSGSVPSPYSSGNPVRGIVTFGTYMSDLPAVTETELAARKLGAWKSKSLTDASVFDFYNHLLDGTNKSDYTRFHASNVTLTQTFFDNRLGFELAYDRQDVRNGDLNLIGQDAANITVDISKTLPDGSPNPNVGRPMVIGNGGNGGLGNFRIGHTESERAQVFADLKMADYFGAQSWISRIFGRNTFTGLLSNQEADTDSRRWIRWHLDQSFAPNASNSVGSASKDNNLYIYLGDSLLGASTASGLYLPGVPGTIRPVADGTVNVYNNETNTFVSYPLTLLNNDAVTDDAAREYTAATKVHDEVQSRAFVWQGYWFGDTVVPMIGVRHDANSNRFVKAPQDNSNAVYGLDTADYQLPNSAADLTSRKGISSTTADSRTYSLVLHTPQWIRRHLPLGLDISPYYNRSENIQAQPGRVDVIGDSIANPQGTTKEFGVRLSVLDGRISVRWGHYETKATNISAPSIGSSQFEIGHSEGFGQAAMHDYRDNPGLGQFSGKVYGITSDGHKLTWRPDGPIKQVGTTYTYTQQEIDTTWAKEKASIDAWAANPVPQSFQDIWGLSLYSDAAYNAAFAANPSQPPGGIYSNNPGVTVTQDQVSKGDEFELTGTPIHGLDIMITASKVSAYRANLAPSFVQWANERWAVFQGPAGDMRVSAENDGEGNSTDYPGQNGDTVRNLYKNVMANILFEQRNEGLNVPELKPWHFSAVVNYAFGEGRLQGLNVGGAFRWSDRSVTGYPVKLEADGVNAYFDVTHPYKGNSESIVDLWAGYRWKLKGKFRWKTQINVRNAFAKKDLIPVTVQPDGTPAGYRIPEPRTIAVTNTLEF
ncbi:MAG TPA: TonB-dependent receptor plug domain-containing protein [Opitutus sp.]|nr:TonB-dependent receptor plug domain-containing protein [Opitutus sp.]